MHNFFAPPAANNTTYKGDTLHTDYLTISGATLETLFHAFQLEYSHGCRRYCWVQQPPQEPEQGSHL